MSELTHKYFGAEGPLDSPPVRDRVIVLIGAFGVNSLDEDKVALLPYAFDELSSAPDEVVIAPDEHTDGQHIDFLLPASTHPEDAVNRALDRVRSAIGSVGLVNAEPKAVFVGPGDARTLPPQEAWHEMDEYTSHILDYEQQDRELPPIPDVLNPRELF